MKKDTKKRPSGGMFAQLVRGLVHAWQDYQLGRLIRKHEISVMRIESGLVGGAEWSSCDQRMSEDFGHGGKWGSGETARDAAKSILNANIHPPRP